MDGVVTATEAAPKNFAALTLGGIASPAGACQFVSFPAGKALIIRSVFADLYQPPSTPSANNFWSLRKGTTCSGPDIITEHSGSEPGGKTIQLEPGFGVSASAGGVSLFLKDLESVVKLSVTTYV